MIETAVDVLLTEFTKKRKDQEESVRQTSGA